MPSTNVRRVSGQDSEDETGSPDRAERGRRRGRRRPGEGGGRRPGPPRRAPRREAGPLPQGPPRLLPGLPPADLPIAPLGPAAARFPFLFPEPRGGCRLAAAGPGTADGSRLGRVRPPGRSRSPPPGPASAAVGWMRGGCSAHGQAGAAAEAGRAPPSQRRGPG